MASQLNPWKPCKACLAIRRRHLAKARKACALLRELKGTFGETISSRQHIGIVTDLDLNLECSMNYSNILASRLNAVADLVMCPHSGMVRAYDAFKTKHSI